MDSTTTTPIKETTKKPAQATSPRYPKPGPIGGQLVRDVVSFVKSQDLKLPLSSHILIALSGGSDSLGLAHLLVHFGRRIVPRAQISLLHVNHGWRGQESDNDELFVKNLGKKWKVPVIIHRLGFNSAKHDTKKSWEDEARDLRKNIFVLEAEKHDALVFTAHQADDQAETLLWRIFTGAAQTHGGGVVFRHGVEMRPFLACRKALIQNYLLEMGQEHREDATNHSNRFLRSRMRSELMPAIEKLFPRSIDHLVKLALSAQADVANLGNTPLNPYDTLMEVTSRAGIRMRRPHFEILSQKLVAKKSWCGEIHLPGGWKLICQPPERWILERI